jgi:hypothetical protein
MGGHPFPEIPCILCNKAVDLSADLYADENGKAVHEHCYVNRVTNRQNTPDMCADYEGWRVHQERRSQPTPAQE